jgi:hypothetical protein
VIYIYLLVFVKVLFTYHEGDTIWLISLFVRRVEILDGLCMSPLVSEEAETTAEQLGELMSL